MFEHFVHFAFVSTRKINGYHRRLALKRAPPPYTPKKFLRGLRLRLDPARQTTEIFVLLAPARKNSCLRTRTKARAPRSHWGAVAPQTPRCQKIFDHTQLHLSYNEWSLELE